MILWFTGISGVGKTTIATFAFKKFKKKYKNLIHLDGDVFRSIFKNDLGYSLKDRNINAERIISLVKLLDKQKINLIISANLTSTKYRNFCKKNFKNYLEVNIKSDISNLIKRDKKNIYKKKNKKDIVGFGIKNINNNTAGLIIENNKNIKVFLNNFKIILKKINKKFKFY